MTGQTDPSLFDCLIVGGGPAGLTAAIYLARYHLRVVVVDSRQSRAELIPLSRNLAGYPGGISGLDLLSRMNEHAGKFGVVRREGEVQEIAGDQGRGFIATLADDLIQARSVLLATGVVNRRPGLLDDQTHAHALSCGLIRYCPICDGYEVTDRTVAVVGTSQRGCDEALFLRSFTRDVTLIAPDHEHDLDDGQRQSLAEAGIAIAGGYSGLWLADGHIILSTARGALAFDSLYPALGSDIRSQLARPMGADMSDEGCLVVDSHQRTTVPGLYAAGDVVLGLDQISNAMGQGGVAATSIRNDLAKTAPLLR